MSTPRRLLPLAALLFLGLGALAASGAPVVVAYPLVGGLFVIAGLALTVGARDLKREIGRAHV